MDLEKMKERYELKHEIERVNSVLFWMLNASTPKSIKVVFDSAWCNVVVDGKLQEDITQLVCDHYVKLHNDLRNRLKKL